MITPFDEKQAGSSVNVLWMLEKTGVKGLRVLNELIKDMPNYGR